VPIEVTKRTKLHVVPRGEDWIVRKEGNSRIISTHSTQREALDVARNVARSGKGELIIHGRDGRILDRKSYNPDPVPPKSPRRVLFHETVDKANRKAVQKSVEAIVRKPRATTSASQWESQHVIPHEGGWAVKAEGRSKPTSIHDSQRGAIQAAKDLIRQSDGKLFVHARDGRIRTALNKGRKN
jgi:hypothetical protein